jgi:hypothetical protein
MRVSHTPRMATMKHRHEEFICFWVCAALMRGNCKKDLPKPVRTVLTGTLDLAYVHAGLEGIHRYLPGNGNLLKSIGPVMQRFRSLMIAVKTHGYFADHHEYLIFCIGLICHWGWPGKILRKTCQWAIFLWVGHPLHPGPGRIGMFFGDSEENICSKLRKLLANFPRELC